MSDDHPYLGLRDFDSLDYTVTTKPGSTIMKITIAYSDGSNEMEYAIWSLQNAHGELKARAARRKADARAAAQKAGSGRKSGRRPAAIGREPPLLMIPHFPPEDEA